MSIGHLRVSHVSDGVIQGSRRTWFNGIAPSEWMPVVGVTDPDTSFTVNFGGFVITGDGHVTVVDTGWGHRAGEVPGLTGAGEMPARLGDLGIAPDDVDRVIQTHLHADHCGWLVEDDEGSLTFPRAAVHVHEREVAYWTGDEVNAIESNRAMVPKVRPRIAAVAAAGRLHTFDGELPLSDAVTVLPAHGHTPGHAVVVVASAGETAILAGDLAHHPAHVEHHDWLPKIDHYPSDSIESRKKIAGLAAERNAVILAPHFPIPTVVDVDREPDGRIRAAVRRDGGASIVASAHPGE